MDLKILIEDGMMIVDGSVCRLVWVWIEEKSDMIRLQWLVHD